MLKLILIHVGGADRVCLLLSFVDIFSSYATGACKLLFRYPVLACRVHYSRWTFTPASNESRQEVWPV